MINFIFLNRILSTIYVFSFLIESCKISPGKLPKPSGPYLTGISGQNHAITCFLKVPLLFFTIFSFVALKQLYHLIIFVSLVNFHFLFDMGFSIKNREPKASICLITFPLWSI